MVFTLFGAFNVKTCSHCMKAKANIKATPGFKLLHCSLRVGLIFESEGAWVGVGFWPEDLGKCSGSFMRIRWTIS